MQSKVDCIVAESRLAKIEVGPMLSELTIVTKTNEVQKYKVTDSLPEVDNPFKQQVYKLASAYVLLNPPLLKGEVICSPIEKEEHRQGLGLYVPKLVSQERWFNERTKQYEGPFEGIYRPGNKTTISQVEAVINTLPQTTKERVEFYSRIMDRIAPKYNNSKYPMHRIFNLRSQGPPIIERYRGAIDFKHDETSLWQQYTHFNNFARVKDVYEPYYFCLLPPGTAEKALTLSYLRWIMQKIGAAGIYGGSMSTQWSYIKALAARNVAISMSNSTRKLDDDCVGEYETFSPTLRLEDMEGMAAPTVTSSGVVLFTPSDPSRSLDQLVPRLSKMKAAGFYGVAAFYHPSLVKPGWGVFPLNMKAGIVLCVYGQEMHGFTADQLTTMFSKFVTGRILYPYTRRSWPILASDFTFRPVVLKNGTEKFRKYDDEWMEFGDAIVEPLSPQELQAIEEGIASPIQAPQLTAQSPLPIPLPPPVAPVPETAGHDMGPSMPPAKTAEAQQMEEDDAFMKSFIMPVEETPEDLVKVAQEYAKARAAAFGVSPAQPPPAKTPEPQKNQGAQEAPKKVVPPPDPKKVGQAQTKQPSGSGSSASGQGAKTAVKYVPKK